MAGLTTALANALSIDPEKRAHGLAAIKRIRAASGLPVHKTAPPKPRLREPDVATMPLGDLIKMAQGTKVKVRP